MHEINFVVKYDDAFKDKIDACDLRMRELHKDYVENHDRESWIEGFRKKIEYKVAYYRWRHYLRKNYKLARRWIEYDGRVFDINWEKIGGHAACEKISDILEAEKLAAIEAAEKIFFTVSNKEEIFKRTEIKIIIQPQSVISKAISEL